MCGIYGSLLPYSSQEVAAKMKLTNFRGPDFYGYKAIDLPNGKKLSLAHNRLSILDLDQRSHQPFVYDDSISIVYNGEVYNYNEVKKVLSNLGYTFRTTSDTEVICAAYLEYGKDCVRKFNGMFAFVIHDAKKQILFGARDRLGQKPFYYSTVGEGFEFASQLSSIQLHNQHLSISKNAILDYLSWGVIPDTSSIFNEVNKLPAGHLFVYDITSRHFETESYWDIDISKSPSFAGSYGEAKDELEEILADAVKIRLVADVPVGVFLSGGVDSSLVAALATKTTSEKIRTFSVKFNEKGFDESQYAAEVANHLQTDHHIIECDPKEGIDLVENFTDFYDEPFSDSSAIPSMLLAKYTRQHVTVALSGDGGDESFLGYHRYNWLTYLSKIYAIPKFLRLFGAEILKLAPNYRLKIISETIKNKNIDEAYLRTMSNSNATWLETPRNTLEFEELKYLFHKNKNIYERASDFDLKTYLNWDINTKVDRATMAYSLEARAPLMDYRVVDFARSLPTDYKFIKGNQKRILKDILYKHAPKEIFDRPKAGFTMPFKEWFKKDLKDFVLSELSENELKAIPGIKVGEVTKMIDQHMTGSWNRYSLIWKLLVLKQWLKTNGKGLSIK
ncbi:asparagine synthase (glutamine-hydrolyzing) [Flagellimonas allohymeniacidonis]|uniref:asparagine synthase (glutamine-hydrolyzing) n=1 Tax=Flagellimonas allohymeniacidonis TaxID=2517819 RepID=A0A4Q8QDL5_9FLAO|nr:asparagine synthase (glutamine-hydrolyzing) [Allomuricauda hymeniacidonis]TAI48572.1 asparagine synthase (glutamine-hydrolyzing) [Allomuricauda hymeniacidonis]